MIYFINIILFKNNTFERLHYLKKCNFEKKIKMGVGGIFIGTLALIFAIVIVMEIKQRLF